MDGKEFNSELLFTMVEVREIDDKEVYTANLLQEQLFRKVTPFTLQPIHGYSIRTMATRTTTIVTTTIMFVRLENIIIN